MFAVSFIALLFLSTARSEQCTTYFKSFAEFAAADSELSILSKALHSRANISEQIDVSMPLTIFAPTDKAFVKTFYSDGKDALNILNTGNTLEWTGKILGLGSQHVLMNAYSPRDLISIKKQQSVLGVVLRRSFPLTFRAVHHKVRVTAFRSNTTATIKQSTKVCNSWVHDVSAFLLPARDIRNVPSISGEFATLHPPVSQSDVTEKSPDTIDTIDRIDNTDDVAREQAQASSTSGAARSSANCWVVGVALVAVITWAAV